MSKQKKEPMGKRYSIRLYPDEIKELKKIGSDRVRSVLRNLIKREQKKQVEIRQMEKIPELIQGTLDQLEKTCSIRRKK
jgi:hypothetical protein